MTLSPNVEADILRVYHAYWDAYLGGDMQTMSSCMDEACQIIGSGKGETFDDRAAALAYYEATVDQIANKSEMRDRNIRLVPAGDLVQIIERSDFYVQVEDAWTYYGPARISTLMGRKGGAWKILHQHGSLPDARTGGGEQVNTDAIKQENYRLKDAIKRRTIELEQKNRELEIEAALERVRAVAMGMQTPEELADISAVIFTELKGLGFSDLRNTEVIIDEPDKEAILSYYYSDYGVTGSIEVFYRSHPRVAGWFEELQKAGDGFATVVIGEDEIDGWRAYREAIGYRPDPRLDDADSVFYYSYATGLGALSISTFRPVSETQIRTLERFRNVFGLAYRRYADVDRARAQAREAQIEAALERVRSRTMAMQRSEDLADLSFELVKQVQALGVATWFCAFNIYDEDGKGALEWGSNGEGVFPRYRTPREGIFLRYFEAGQRGETLLINEIGEDECPAHYAYLCTLPGVGEQLLKMKDAGLSFPTSQIDHVAYFKYGYLLFITYEPVPESHDIFKRFARVFEQAYTRFLDLKKAEAQAREAKVEAALERVRARTMAMQRSEELSEVAAVIYEQLNTLGFRTLQCGFDLVDPETHAMSHWITNADGEVVPASGKASDVGILADLHPVTAAMFRAWKRGDPGFFIELSGEDLDSYMAMVKTYLTIPDAAWIGERLADVDRIFINHFHFSQGVLSARTLEPLTPEQRDVGFRFMKVFDLAYTRFLDLQKAEAQAREAIRAASLDRVRAEIASMRTAADLDRITPLLWRELTTLGIPFLRCGVFIAEEDAARFRTHLSRPDGAALAAFDLPFDSAPTTDALAEHWRAATVYREEWDRDRFLAWMRSMVAQGVIEEDDYPARQAPPESLALLFAPFAQGMLYVGSPAPLSDDDVAGVQSLADAFAVAYARYEDFRKLEAAKAEVERAYDELHEAKDRLVQSEKLASLGALTAGIAHEIKNPLNFINNFAELNEELAEEVLEVLEAGDLEEARTILDDLRQNAAIINRHGKRADGIVRSMMQHARSGESRHEPVDVNAFVEEYLNLAYHGQRARVPGFNADLVTDLGADVGTAQMMPQEMGRVLINLLGNAFDAVHEHAQSQNGRYAPQVTVSTRRANGHVEIRVADNGPGIPADVKAKIFEPFFTTKPTGSGTGLGLSLSHDIVTQGHGGTLTVESAPGEGAAFVVTVPG